MRRAPPPLPASAFDPVTRAPGVTRTVDNTPAPAFDPPAGDVGEEDAIEQGIKDMPAPKKS